MRRRNRVTNRIADFEADRNLLINKGLRAAKRIGVNARIACIRSYVGGGDAVDTLMQGLMDFKPLILEACVAAHLSGRLRSIETAAKKIGSNKSLAYTSPYESASEFMKARLELSEFNLAFLREKYNTTAVDVTNLSNGLVESRAREAVVEITEGNMHVRQGIAHLREAISKAGIEPESPWLLETLVRTQIGIAYGAGRWNANQDPVIRQILWGYVYTTVGDDRVRPNHELLDGTELPKEDPQWSEIWPPNGYNCRCDTVEIFHTDKPKVVLPKPPAEIDGKVYDPVADEGWRTNAGIMYNDMISIKG